MALVFWIWQKTTQEKCRKGRQVQKKKKQLYVNSESLITKNKQARKKKKKNKQKTNSNASHIAGAADSCDAKAALAKATQTSSYLQLEQLLTQQ